MQLQWRDRAIRGASRTFVRCEGDYTVGGGGDWQGMMNRLLIPLHLLPSPLTVSTSLHLIATTQTPLISRTFCAQKHSFLYLLLTVSKLHLLKSFAFIHLSIFSADFSLFPSSFRLCPIEHILFASFPVKTIVRLNTPSSLSFFVTYLLNGCETNQVLRDLSLIRSIKIGKIIEKFITFKEFFQLSLVYKLIRLHLIKWY